MKRTHLASSLALAFAATFLVLLALLHVIEPEFDPSWRMISEYELGAYGWLMSVAFFCWGGSVVSLVVALWPSLQTRAGRIARVWFSVIGAALFGAGVFLTKAITDPTPSTNSSLHNLCGAIVILTFPIAASLAVRSVLVVDGWASVRGRVRLATALLWLGLVGFMGTVTVMRALHPGVRAGPEIAFGWPNRLMVVAYLSWILVVAGRARALSANAAR